MRTLKRNSADVKNTVAKLWAERSEHVSANITRYPVEAVLAAVAQAHGLSVDLLRTYCRTNIVSHARHHAVWELRRRRLDLSYDQIAADLNRVNHATALHSFTVFCEYVKRGRFAAERAAVAKLLGDET
jgi:chromosomal replication initiation ATPase DnaA